MDTTLEIPTTNSIALHIGDDVVILLTKDGFFYKGEKVEDINDIYDRFSKWMSMAENK